MEAIILLVALIGYEVSGYDFATLFFYIELAVSLGKYIEDSANDKTTNGK